MMHAASIISQALSNARMSTLLFNLKLYIFSHLLDQIEWSIKEFSARAVRSKVGSWSNEKQTKLNAQFLPLSEITLCHPAVVLDRDGVILLWNLPGVIPERLMVCPLSK